MSWTIPRVYTIGRSPLIEHITHEISKHPKQPKVPEIVSLLPNEKKFTEFRNLNSTSTQTIYSNKSASHTSSIQLMSSFQPPIYGNGEYVHIKNLIFHYDKSSFNHLKTCIKCLDKTSNILLLNSDKSVLDHLLRTTFNNQFERPNIFQCLHDFRLWSNKDFHTNAYGFGGLRLARVPRDLTNKESYDYDLQNNLDRIDLMKLISEVPSLNSIFLKYNDFALLQYEHLIVKSSISVFSSLFDVTNGELLQMHISEPLKKYIKECVKIISSTDPIIMGNSFTNTMFDIDRLLDVIFTILKKTERDSSTMRIQFKSFYGDEINNTCGYFTNLSQRNNVKQNLYNSLYTQLLNARLSLKNYRSSKELPLYIEN
ncbi:hypothetical protein WICMUC_002139 [Wickerhamomyces mucosus]|uniref:Ketopantoate reductase C-terminal domain-containing protein n=1 Tax=Wickerhamomyces mucosus TaxID=1378264 RepID=A0A9P8PQ80_9ASCO|nr:hypothetical protein WICMUC_002139 [Wickerhamomyces mucosus]